MQRNSASEFSGGQPVHTQQSCRFDVTDRTCISIALWIRSTVGSFLICYIIHAFATYRHMIRAGVFAYPLAIKKSSYTDFLCLAWTPLVCHARDALSHKVVAALQYILNRAYASPCVVESDAASRRLLCLRLFGIFHMPGRQYNSALARV